MGGGPFHDVNIVGPFWRHDVRVAEVNLHLGTVERDAKRGKPRSFEVWEGGRDVEEKRAG